jgi:type I restriction enzyme S subunit
MAGEIQSTDYGPMAGYYDCTPLGSLCVEDGGVQTGPFGSQLHQEDYVAVGTPIITVEHLGENRIIRSNLPRVSDEDKARLSRYSLQDGDIVFSRVGSVDRRALVRQEEDGWLFSGRCLRVRVDKKQICPQFLSWVFGLEGFKEHIRRVAVGATMPSINTKILSDIPVYYPPLAEQKAIAAVLGSLDDKIELNRRMNDTLEAMARALFQSWFVEFDPVRAKLDGRQPIGLDKATAALFPATFQDSTLGHIPKGWETGSILQQADLLSGGTPKTDIPVYWNGDVPWASAKDVSQCGEAFLISTERTVTNLGVQESSTKIIPEFATVVVARGATTGRLTMFGHSMAMNQTCYGLRSKVDAPFALYCNARHFIERLVQGGHGSIFDTITTSTFEATFVLLAPNEILLAFDKQVKPLFHIIRANLYQSRTLATLRDTLLPKLLSGELSTHESHYQI